jgi:hypothetical protein
MSFCLPKSILPPLSPLGFKGDCQNIATRFSLMAPVKLSGRPPLKEGKRNFRITARFSEEEYQAVEKLEEALGISKTEIIRSRLLENRRAIVVNTKELISGLDRIGTELRRSGNNINQLAHYVNILKLKDLLSPEVAGQFNALFEDYILQRKDLDTSLRNLIRIMLPGS